ncbi:MAG TPA: MFS transporter [Cyanobacteria bacterium UBA8530]|nr:MFS transporter [Cyanobacteria bacterium UBA8530]
MIVVENLSKRYADRLVVDGVSFHADRGEILGFLGPNGAGKTTTMRMITGFLSPSGGTVRVGGLDVQEESLKVRRMIGYLPETPPLYPEMNVSEYLHFVGRLREIPARDLHRRVSEVLSQCFLQDVEKKLINHLSKGYKQRVGLAQALIHRPRLLILDEPTSGLDPKQIIQIRELIKDLAVDHTVILSTHILPEVQHTCSRVLITNGGKVVAEDSPERLEAQLKAGERISLKVRAPREDLEKLFEDLPGIGSFRIRSVENACLVEIAAAGDLRELLAREIVQAGWGLLELRSLSLSMEEIFLKLTTEEKKEKNLEVTADV